MNEIRKHVFVCVNERDENNPRGCCSSKGSLEVMTLLKRTNQTERNKRYSSEQVWLPWLL